MIRGTEYRTEREEARYQVPYLPLDDYSGGDYEAVENDMDDDMMKVIEGGWWNRGSYGSVSLQLFQAQIIGENLKCKQCRWFGLSSSVR